MVLAVTAPKLVHANGRRLNGGAALIGLASGVREASRRGELKKAEADAQRRAQLMITAQCSVYITPEMPVGSFKIIDPDTLEPADRAICPFKVKTLVVHPDDVEKALEHFKAPT